MVAVLETIMKRPPLEPLIQNTKGMLQCACGNMLSTWESIAEHWTAGHFDYEETIDNTKLFECLSATRAMLKDTACEALLSVESILLRRLLANQEAIMEVMINKCGDSR